MDSLQGCFLTPFPLPKGAFVASPHPVSARFPLRTLSTSPFLCASLSPERHNLPQCETSCPVCSRAKSPGRKTPSLKGEGSYLKPKVVQQLNQDEKLIFQVQDSGKLTTSSVPGLQGLQLLALAGLLLLHRGPPHHLLLTPHHLPQGGSCLPNLPASSK